MKNIVAVIIVVLCLVYFGQATKAVKVKEVKLKYALQEGKISQDQFNNESKNNSLGKMLLDPKSVMSVD